MPALERGPRILERAVAGHGLDADQADALQAPGPRRTSSAVGTEPADEPGREASARRLDLLREEPGDLAQREPHDPAEAPEPDLPGLEPEPVDLDHHAVGELEEMRPIGEGGRAGVGGADRPPSVGPAPPRSRRRRPRG